MKRTTFQSVGVLGLLTGLAVAGFWFTPMLVAFWERVFPFINTRWGYAFFLYGVSRWMGALGCVWALWVFHNTRLSPTTLRSSLAVLLYPVALLAGVYWLLVYAVCADPEMWVEGDSFELLLYESPQQAQLFTGGLIAANLLLGLFGFYFAKAAGGTVTLVWQGVALEAWLGLAIQVGLLWVVVKGVIRSVPRWRASHWMKRMAYGWWGVAAFHTAIASSGRFSDFLDAVMSSGMVAIVFAMFTVVWLILLWYFKPPESGEDK